MTPAALMKSLPCDLAQCHALIEELARTLAEKERLAAQLKQQVAQLLKRLYGPRAERIDPAQLVLFAEAMTAPEPEAAPAQETPALKPGKGHGRKPLPKDLRRKRVVHDVPAEQKV